MMKSSCYIWGSVEWALLITYVLTLLTVTQWSLTVPLFAVYILCILLLPFMQFLRSLAKEQSEKLENLHTLTL